MGPIWGLMVSGILCLKLLGLLHLGVKFKDSGVESFRGSYSILAFGDSVFFVYIFFFSGGGGVSVAFGGFRV